MKAKPHKKSAGSQQQISGKPAAKVIGRPFPKGVSGNPSGRRRGSVSPTAALRRALTRADAERIASKLIAAAKGGDLTAAKILFDRLDHPLGGPLAIALSQANSNAAAATMPVQVSPATQVHVIIADNHRGDRAEGVQVSEVPPSQPAAETPAVPVPAAEPAAEPATLDDSDDEEPLPLGGVIDAAEFLSS